MKLKIGQKERVLMKYKKRLILNLTRLGDIVQTTPFIQYIKNKFPNDTIDLLVHKRFKKITELVDNIDNIYEIDYDEALYFSLNKNIKIKKSFGYIKEFVDRIKNKKYDIVYNFTHSRVSALFCSLFEIDEIVGINIEKRGFRVISHPWSRLFFTTSFNRLYNNFNLVDLYLKAGDADNLKESNLNLNVIENNNILKNYTDKNLEKYFIVGVSPGASDKLKTWEPEKFGQLIFNIYKKKDSFFIILGTKNDIKKGEIISKFIPKENILDLTGKTDIIKLTQILNKCNILISNDTGTQHIAAAIKTKIYSLVMGNTSGHETAPYIENSIVIHPDISCYPCDFDKKCDYQICHNYFHPDLIAEIILGNYKKKIKTLKVWETKKDSYGFLFLKPVIKREASITEYFSWIQRGIFIKTLDPPYYCEKYPQKITDDFKNSFYIPKSIPKSIYKAVIHLYDISGKVSNLITSIVKNSFLQTKENIQNSIDTIDKIDKDIKNTAHSNPEIAGIYYLFNIERESLVKINQDRYLMQLYSLYIIMQNRYKLILIKLESDYSEIFKKLNIYIK